MNESPTELEQIKTKLQGIIDAIDQTTLYDAMIDLGTKIDKQTEALNTMITLLQESKTKKEEV